MASGAQLNRWGTRGGVPLLTLTSGLSAVSSPLTAYGTIGGNESGSFVTPIGMQTYTFLMIGGGSGYTVTIYGTIDPAAYDLYTAAGDGVYSFTGTSGHNFGVAFSVPATSWAPLPGPSEQSGTGLSANPITQTGLFFQAKIALVAVRATLTATSTPSGTCAVLGFAVP